MMVSLDSLEDLELIGGRPSLDFTNTEGGERNGPPERLESYHDLVAWSLYAGVVDEPGAGRLEDLARERPREAARVFGRAIELREALYRIFVAIVSGASPAEPDLDVLDRELAEALTHLRVVPAGERFAWRFVEGDERLDRMLWTIVDDAADLLSSDTLERVKECGGDSCAWLFYDESRNRSRRWCDMGDCGNRAKVRRYYRRRREREA